jgi:CspA family cold shock protein
MPKGTVKWFDVRKGYGFIVGPEGQDVFVHFSNVDGEGFRTLKDGETVDYELKDGDKGLYADNVARISRPFADQTADGQFDGIARAGNDPEASVGRQQNRLAGITESPDSSF